MSTNTAEINKLGKKYINISLISVVLGADSLLLLIGGWVRAIWILQQYWSFGHMLVLQGLRDCVWLSWRVFPLLGFMTFPGTSLSYLGRMLSMVFLEVRLMPVACAVLYTCSAGHGPLVCLGERGSTELRITTSSPVCRMEKLRWGFSQGVPTGRGRWDGTCRFSEGKKERAAPKEDESSVEQ